MTDILTDLSPSALTAAVKGNLYALFYTMRDSSSGTEGSSPGFRWRTGVSHPWFNGTLNVDSPASDPSHIIDETVDYFRAHDVTAFSWWLAPYLDAAGWSEYLLGNGFQYDDHTPGMAIDLATLPQIEGTPVAIRQVADRQTLAQWTRIFVRGFGMPEKMVPGFLALMESLGNDLPFRNYLAYIDDKPVATSTLFLGAGVAGVYNVATLPEARGQGIGSAMTLAPLYDARALGYRWGTLQSSEMGYIVYQRLGFQKLCQIDYFYWRAPGPQSNESGG